MIPNVSEIKVVRGEDALHWPEVVGLLENVAVANDRVVASWSDLPWPCPDGEYGTFNIIAEILYTTGNFWRTWPIKELNYDTDKHGTTIGGDGVDLWRTIEAASEDDWIINTGIGGPGAPYGAIVGFYMASTPEDATRSNIVWYDLEKHELVSAPVASGDTEPIPEPQLPLVGTTTPSLAPVLPPIDKDLEEELATVIVKWLLERGGIELLIGLFRK